MARPTYSCADCTEAQAVTLAAARRHAKAAPPVWRADRQAFTSHGLPRDPSIPERLAAIREAIEAESVSYGELAELQLLAEHIPTDDLVLREWAGFPEHDETEQETTR